MERGAEATLAVLALLVAGGPAVAATRPGPAAGGDARKAPAATTARDPARPPPAAASRKTAASVADAADSGTGKDLAQVRKLAAAGRLSEAEKLCSRLLAAQPGRVELLLERAQLRAEQRKYSEARVDYNDVLVITPADTRALVGLGWTLADAGDLDSADWTFRRALAVDAGTLEAEKGLAYVALWRGDAADAARRFEFLSRTRPDDASLLVALGQALTAAGRPSEARDAFDQALAVEPGRADAVAGRGASGIGARVDATVLGGVGLRTAGTDDLSVRRAELALEPGERVRVFARYDDLADVEDAGLSRRLVRVAAVLAGARFGAAGGTRTTVEAGYRRLPGAMGQALVRADQRFAVGAPVVLRLGGLVAPREDRRIEGSAHAGVEVRAGRLVTIAPAVFWHRSGVGGDDEVRAVLAVAATSASGGALGVGAAAGRGLSSAAGQASGAGFFRAVLPVGGRVRAEFVLTHERPAVGPSLTVYALGVGISAPGR